MITKYRCIHVPQDQTIFVPAPAKREQVIHYGNFRFSDGVAFAALCLACSQAAPKINRESLISVSVEVESTTVMSPERRAAIIEAIESAISAPASCPDGRCDDPTTPAELARLMTLRAIYRPLEEAPAGFVDHLEACQQCREQPFDLCPDGMRFLTAST